MPNSENGFNYILVMLCEISNFMVTTPLYTATSPEICKALQDNLICVFGTPMKLICDQDPAFMSHLTQTMLQSYGNQAHNCEPHKSQILVGRTWDKIPLQYNNETFDWPRVGLGYLLQTCNVGIQQLCLTKLS